MYPFPSAPPQISYLDEQVVQEVLETNTYGLVNIEKAGLPVRRVIDLGAHVGSFERSCRIRWPEAEITCVEANPDLLDSLFHNTGEKTKVVWGAVGSNSSTWTEWIDERGNTQYACGGFVQKANNWAPRHKLKTLDVPRFSLEDLLEDWPVCDILKVDIEGSEFELFETTPPEVLARCLFITGEVHMIEEKSYEDFQRTFEQRFPHFMFNFKTPLHLDTVMFMACPK